MEHDPAVQSGGLLGPSVLLH